MSDLETSFDYHWRILDGPDLEPEYRFDAEYRSRFDRAHVATRVAIEIEGGTWGKKNKDGELVPGRHNRGNGYTADCIKYNRATAQGWAVFRLTSDMLRDDPAGHLTPIMATIDARLTRWSSDGVRL